MEASTLSSRIRFGRFEVDPESCELFKDGRRIRLQGQPVQILLMLLEKPGRLVTREELQQRLWPKDTFVDFDYGLNAAIKRLRESLGDSADEPLYIETLPRRGYRFIFPVEGMPAIAPRLASPPSPSLILRLWQAVTQSPASPPGTEGKTPLPAPSEMAPATTLPERPEEPVQRSEVAPRSLETGHRLGSYEVLSLLGRGGMGEVYMARDSRLDRQVALKVLPDEFTKDPERLARFEREAKLLASLNHPNVAAICGLEEIDSRRFLILELVEGETLAEQLERGPLPLETALGVCRQIAEGLEAAHEKGIIHRDLKPANIKITPEETVKILDFSLARAFQKDGSLPGLPKPPVITDEINGPATIVGTVAYMSPNRPKGNRSTSAPISGPSVVSCLSASQGLGPLSEIRLRRPLRGFWRDHRIGKRCLPTPH